jgi:hypothetical protein
MKVGIGYSTAKDSREAAVKAAEAAVASSGEPVLTFLFTTDSYDQSVVFETVKKVVGNSKMAGICGAGIITSAGVLPQAIAVGTLSGSELGVSTSLQHMIQGDHSSAGSRAGREMLSSGIGNGTVIVLPDGFASGVSEMLQSLYNEMGPDFQYIGGGAGDNLRFFKTYQLTEAGVHSNAVATVLLNGIFVETSIGHGWRPRKDILVITKAKGKKILEIDGRPAFDVYSELLGGIPLDQFSAWGMKHPLGTPDIQGNYLIRDPISVNEDKSIDLVTEIPANTVANIMEGNIDWLVSAARSVATEAAGKVVKPQFALVFDCISRYLFMGSDFGQEVNAIKEAVGREVPLLGVLTFGEIGSHADFPQFHNKTLTLGVFGTGKYPDDEKVN